MSYLRSRMKFKKRKNEISEDLMAEYESRSFPIKGGIAELEMDLRAFEDTAEDKWEEFKKPFTKVLTRLKKGFQNSDPYSKRIKTHINSFLMIKYFSLSVVLALGYFFLILSSPLVAQDNESSDKPTFYYGNKGWHWETGDGNYATNLQLRLQLRYSYPFRIK